MAQQLLKWHHQKAIFGPLSYQQIKDGGYVVNSFFTVPKGNNKARPILNLSDKRKSGFSINDDIKCLNPDIATVEYIQQREVV